MLKRGRTATSLSVPGHQSARLCVYDAMNVLRLQGLNLWGLRGFFPKLEQITISGQCLASGATSRSTCSGCFEAFCLHLSFNFLLSDVRVCLLLFFYTGCKVCIKKFHAMWSCLHSRAHQRGGALQVVNLVAPHITTATVLLQSSSTQASQGCVISRC